MKHDAALDRMADTLIRESDARAFGTSNYDALMEKWSDAARAAAVAARKARSGGKDWRKAGRQAYLNKGGRRADLSGETSARFKSVFTKAGGTFGRSTVKSGIAGDKAQKADSATRSRQMGRFDSLTRKLDKAGARAHKSAAQKNRRYWKSAEQDF